MTGTVLGDCIYCDERLANEKKSVTCEHCGDGYHVPCAQAADGFDVTEESHLLRSSTYEITCPRCGETWSVGFDPLD